LRALLVVNALAFGLYVFARLDRPVAERFGPVGEAVYNALNPSEPTSRPLSARGQRFINDVMALGGLADVRVMKPGFLWIFGRTEWFHASLRTSAFDDQALARLAESYGDRINQLDLENTAVTDAGLRHLNKMTMLRHLQLRHNVRLGLRGVPGTPAAITDAGLVHLQGLTQLQTLNLSDLPITDAGVAALQNLPALSGLDLSRTKVQGTSLGRLRVLPQLSLLYLDRTALTEDRLRALAGATNLQFLSLRGIPLTAQALPLLRSIPRLKELEITGCGFLDGEVDALIKSRPELKVVRR
jgi:Leucine-rich repeat (LRR) protein